MPTYDYLCKACKKSFEIFHSITEPAKKVCPGCGKKQLERQMGPGAGFIFKGSGFYITDYRSPDYQSKAKADAGGGGEKAGAGDAKGSGEKGTGPKGGDAKGSSPAPAASGGSSGEPAKGSSKKAAASGASKKD